MLRRAADLQLLAARAMKCAGRHVKIAVIPGAMAKFYRYKENALRTVTAGDDARRLTCSPRTWTRNGLALHFGRSALDLRSHMVPATAFTMVAASFRHDHR